MSLQQAVAKAIAKEAIVTRDGQDHDQNDLDQIIDHIKLNDVHPIQSTSDQRSRNNDI